MTEDQRVMYASIVKLRNNEVTLRWTRNQIFFFVNIGAVSLVAVQLNIDTALYGLVCGGGLVLSILWLCLVFVIRRWVNFWDNRLAAFESVDIQQVSVFRGEEWQKTKYSMITANVILIALSGAFILVWLVMLIYWTRYYFF